MITAYIDESGTHDQTGIQLGASHATIGGYVGLKDDWGFFKDAWKMVLDKYGIKHFHFSVWANARRLATNGRPNRDSPYATFSASQLNSLIEDLAQVVSDHAVFPFGGWDDTV